MTAETLRRAATLMRERAEAALACDPDPDKHWWSTEGLRDILDHPGVGDAEMEADAAHIASWHPALALAVADWLDRAALENELAHANYPEHAPWPVDDNALAVARAYLGEGA